MPFLEQEVVWQHLVESAMFHDQRAEIVRHINLPPKSSHCVHALVINDATFSSYAFLMRSLNRSRAVCNRPWNMRLTLLEMLLAVAIRRVTLLMQPPCENLWPCPHTEPPRN